MLKSIIRLQVKAQSATSGPPLGPTLGQFGIPTMDFCKKFNEMSKEYEKGILLNTLIYVNYDRTYSIKIKGTPTSYQLMKLLNLEKGMSFNGYFSNSNNLLTNYMLYELFLLQKKNSKDFGFYKAIKGTAFSSGFFILNDQLDSQLADQEESSD